MVMHLHSWLIFLFNEQHLHLTQISMAEERKNGHTYCLDSLNFTLSISKTILTTLISMTRHLMAVRFGLGRTRLHFQACWRSVSARSMTAASSPYPSSVETKFKPQSSPSEESSCLMALLPLIMGMYLLKFVHTCAHYCLISLASVWLTQLVTFKPSQPV